MRKILFIIKQFIKFILRLIFGYVSGGEKCVICNSKTLIYPVCAHCKNKYFSVKEIQTVERCKYCGKELLSTKNECFQCREKPVIEHVDSMFPLFSYRLWNKELMFMWKSLEIRVLSNFFGSILKEVLKLCDGKVIVPVPPRPGKIQKKGWDQIDELCNLLEFFYGFKVLRILERHTEGQQKKLDRENRLKAIGSSYYAVSDSVLKKQLKVVGNHLPEEVILLDDVCTTGATLESCGIILKEMGVKRITGITLFIVD